MNDKQIIKETLSIIDEPHGDDNYYPSFEELGRDVYPDKIKRIREVLLKNNNIKRKALENAIRLAIGLAINRSISKWCEDTSEDGITKIIEVLTDCGIEIE